MTTTIDDRGVRWCVINEFDRYSISELGEVMSNVRGSLLRPFPNFEGRLQVKLTGETGPAISVYVHRLVAEHFLPGFDHDFQVEHKSQDVTDNRPTNLKMSEYRSRRPARRAL